MYRTLMERNYGSLKREIYWCDDLLREAALSEPNLARYGNWMEILEPYGSTRVKTIMNDGIIRSIIRTRQVNADSRWNVILMLLFWSILKRIFYLRAGYTEDGQELWQDICLHFLKVICNPGLVNKPGNLAGLIFNRVSASLRDYYQGLWAKTRKEIFWDSEKWDSLECKNNSPILKADHRIDLWFLKRRRTITRAEYEVLSEPLVSGDCPKKCGAINKQRQRAIRKIRKYLHDPVPKSLVRPQIIDGGMGM